MTARPQADKYTGIYLMLALSMIDVCVVEQGVTCSCCHPGLKMTVRMGPSHFTIWVSVPSFSEDRRNRNSRYEIKGAISQSFDLAPTPLCFLSTAGESLRPLLLSHGHQERFTELFEGRFLLKNHPTHCICVPSQAGATYVISIERHWSGASSTSSRLLLLRTAHVYPAVCTSHKVALDRDMIPTHPHPHLPAVTCLVHSKA